jgi:hypothetical protein
MNCNYNQCFQWWWVVEGFEDIVIKYVVNTQSRIQTIKTIDIDYVPTIE